MSEALLKQLPNATRYQVGALPVREREGRVEVCLVTTRTTGRWTVPKGWRMKGLQDYAAAQLEAEQEAGVTGKPGKKPIGSYLYWKRLNTHFELVEVIVYLLTVKATLAAWKEQAQRRIQWMSLADAALIVDEPGLSALLTQFVDKG